MKTQKKLLVYVALALVPLLFSKCTLNEDLAKLKVSAGNLKVIIGTPQFNTQAHIDFVDAKTNQYITGNADVIISGKNASIIYNNIGQALNSQYKTMNGMLDLVVDPHKVDSSSIKQNPVEFIVTTSLAGYMPVTQKITLSEYRLKSIRILLVKISDAPQGVSVTQNSGFASSSSTGTVQETKVETINGGNQTVEIPQYVILKDATGNPVTGAIASQIVFYDPTSGAAQNSIPGGLDVSSKGQDGTTSNQRFACAGLFNISLSSGGKDVKTFSNGGLKIKTIIPSSLINPNTGVAYKDGDLIEWWSKDEGSTTWAFESKDTIHSDNGQLVSEKVLNHLSYWMCGRWIETCMANIGFAWKGNEINTFSNPLNGTGTEVSVLAFQDGLNSTYSFPVLYGQVSSWNFLPVEDKPLELNFWSNTPICQVFPSTLTVEHPCEGGVYDIMVNPFGAEWANININVSVSSKSNTNLIIKPNIQLLTRDSGAEELYAQNPNSPMSSLMLMWNLSCKLIDGKGTLLMPFGQEYDLLASFGNSSATGKIRVDHDGSTDMLKITVTHGTDTPVIFNTANPSNHNIDVIYDIVVADDVFNSISKVPLQKH